MINKNIDNIINNIIEKYIKDENVDLSKPLSLNIQLTNDNVDISEDLESLIEDNKNYILTMYAPYNINQLRFRFISDYKLVIRSFDYKFYKQFWFSKPTLYNKQDVSFKNNVLELKVKKNENNFKKKNM